MLTSVLASEIGMRFAESEALNIMKEMTGAYYDHTDTPFKGLVICSSFNGSSPYVQCSEGSLLSIEDKSKITEWIFEEGTPYYANIHRLELSDYILLGTLYKLDCHNVFIGYIIENSKKARLNLIELKQEYLLRNSKTNL